MPDLFGQDDFLKRAEEMLSRRFSRGRSTTGVPRILSFLQTKRLPTKLERQPIQMKVPEDWLNLPKKPKRYPFIQPGQDLKNWDGHPKKELYPAQILPLPHFYLKRSVPYGLKKWEP